MPLRTSRLLTMLLLVLALVLAACGGDADSDDATEEPTEAAEATTPEPEAEPTTAEPTAEETTPEDELVAEEEDRADDPVREQAVQEFLAAGLSEEDANCVIDVYAAEGVSMEDVAAVGSGQAPADPEAFATASANLGQCLSPEQLGDFANAAADQDPEAVRAAFIQGFVATGATEEQAGCIFDELTNAGFTLGDLSAAGTNPPPGLQEAATEAGETCGIGQ
ncbi:hypothetical protein [Euzebya tangerina]|uniref:hypothetical protein n=1 Tax=Euzebya tangerina TaxID=591198 RepID=UPI0013C30C54|nr:hypothetical protein [Euzebya tangerina]